MSANCVRPTTRLRWLQLTISCAVYVSITVSTGLQFNWGPEKTLRLAGFYVSAQDSRPADFRAAYPDFGRLSNDAAATEALRHGEHWKFSTFWADAGYYVLQTKQPELSIAPYRYRWLPTMLVRKVCDTTGLTVEHAFLIVNVAASLLTALFFEQYLRTVYRFAFPIALLGGVLYVTSASNVGTLAFPMLEPLCGLFSCLIFMAAATRSKLGFVASSLAGVATKEVLVFSGLLWWVHRKSAEQRAYCLAVAGLPILAFAITRTLQGGSPFEVNYGFDLLRGEFPNYAQRLFQFKSLLVLTLQVFLTFSFLWIGMFWAPKHPQLRRELIIVPAVIVAATLLSGRITRVLGVLFPIVIPAFLWTVDELMRHMSASPSQPGSS